MKLQKYLSIMLLTVITAGFMSSCSDDDSLTAPRLFRPVASLETNKNSITATWDNIKGATRYDLKLFRVAGTDEAGENIYEECGSALNCTPKVRQKTFGVQFVYEKNIHREAQHSKPSTLWGTPETIVRTVSSWAALLRKSDRPLSQIR